MVTVLTLMNYRYKAVHAVNVPARQNASTTDTPFIHNHESVLRQIQTPAKVAQKQTRTAMAQGDPKYPAC